VPCATGNCDWPLTPTIGVCGACQDISTQILSSCNTSTSTCTFTTPTYSTGWTCGVGETGAEYRFRGGNVSLTTPLLNTPAMPSLEDQDNPTTITSLGLGSGLVFQNRSDVDTSALGTAIAVFDVLNVEQAFVPHFDGNLSAPEYGNFSAQSCALWPCAQALRVKTRDGIQNQTLVDSWGVFTDTLMFSDVPEDVALGENITDAGNIFAMAFCGSDSTDTEQGDGASSLFSGQLAIEVTGDSYIGNPIVTAVHEQLLQNEDLDGWIKQVAVSLTNNLRSTGGNLNDTRFAGSVYTSETFITIRWLWLTLPALMVVLSALFLAMMIVETEKSGMPAWKGNPLNILFCKVDGELEGMAGEGMEGGQGKRGVKRAVGDARVRLEREGEGRWGFVKEA